LAPSRKTDAPYSQHKGLIDRISSQFDRIRGSQDLPLELRERYNRFSSALGSPQEEVECSVVNRAAGAYPGNSFGHVITVPDFGAIVLGKLTIKHEDFKPGTEIPRKTTITLTMIDLLLGCAADGHPSVGTGSTNGGTMP
jgi:hypothetical protein